MSVNYNRKKKQQKILCIRAGIVTLWLILIGIIGASFASYPDGYEEKEFNMPITKPISITPASQILLSVDKYAWPNGTEEEKWDYDTGNFKDDSVREIYATLGYDETDIDSDLTPCNHFVDAMVYDALGVKISIMPFDPYEDWEELPSNFKIVHEGPINDFSLMPGDIVRYKKNKKGGIRSQHSFIYYGDGLIAEAGIRTRYPVIYSEYYGGETIKWERDEVDKQTIQVIRIK